MSPLEYLEYLGQWALQNLDKILSSILTIIVLYFAQKIVARGIDTLYSKRRLEEHLAYTLTKISNWFFTLVIISAILTQFGVSLGAISGLLTVLGGTILGFAAINTIGNAIAGIIVMTSRPFSVGDRIKYNNILSDIIAIELIYTKMRTLDNVLVSVPNQELLKSEIDNYGKKRIIRRQCVVTLGFDNDSALVERVLLDAAKKVHRVLENPEPYVYIRGFGNFAVEYILHVFTSDVKNIPLIDSELHRAVLVTCYEYNLDLSTPYIIQQVSENLRTQKEESKKNSSE